MHFLKTKQKILQEIMISLQIKKKKKKWRLEYTGDSKLKSAMLDFLIYLD